MSSLPWSSPSGPESPAKAQTIKSTSGDAFGAPREIVVPYVALAHRIGRSGNYMNTSSHEGFDVAWTIWTNKRETRTRASTGIPWAMVGWRAQRTRLSRRTRGCRASGPTLRRSLATFGIPKVATGVYASQCSHGDSLEQPLYTFGFGQRGEPPRTSRPYTASTPVMAVSSGTPACCSCKIAARREVARGLVRWAVLTLRRLFPAGRCREGAAHDSDSDRTRLADGSAAELSPERPQ